ncbi:hypothetical protein RUND412_009846 [Rhizina undulata]
MDPSRCPTPMSASLDTSPSDLFFPQDMPALSGACMGLVRPIYMKLPDFDTIPDPRIFNDHLVRVSYCCTTYPCPFDADTFGWTSGFDIAFDVPGTLAFGEDEYIPKSQDYLEWLAEAGTQWKDCLRALGWDEWWLDEKGEEIIPVVLRAKTFPGGVYIDSARELSRIRFTSFMTVLPTNPSECFPEPGRRGIDMNNPMCGICVIRQESEKLKKFLAAKRFEYGFLMPKIGTAACYRAWSSGSAHWRAAAPTPQTKMLWDGLRLPKKRKKTVEASEQEQSEEVQEAGNVEATEEKNAQGREKKGKSVSPGDD